MIFGIGTDVVEVSRIHDSIEKFGDTFARRILSDSEFESYLKEKNILSQHISISDEKNIATAFVVLET